MTTPHKLAIKGLTGPQVACADRQRAADTAQAAARAAALSPLPAPTGRDLGSNPCERKRIGFPQQQQARSEGSWPAARRSSRFGMGAATGTPSTELKAGGSFRGLIQKKERP